MNLLNYPWLKRFLKSSWFPRIFQWASVVVFAAIMGAALFGPTNPSQNFGLAVTWVLWWPIIPLTFFLLGRFWCAVCPFAWLSDLVQKYFGAEKPVPKFLRKYGIWIIDAFFILITWADHIWGIVGSPRGSGYLLLIMTGAVILMGALFERRTFCRYVCFIGGLSGNYSRTGVLELRTNPDVCKDCTTQSCFKGDGKTAGCPMFEFPRTKEDSTKCNLCANCVKTCPNDSVQIVVRKPTAELWNIRKPKLEEVFLACVIMGIVLIQNVTMLSIWPAMLDTVKAVLGTSSFEIAFTVLFAIFMAVPVVAMGLVSLISKILTGDREKTIRNFTLFGYAIIPLDLAAHLAHNAFHLLTELKAVGYVTLSLFGLFVSGDPSIVQASSVFFIQVAILGIGTFGSLYGAYRIAKNHYPDKTWMAFLPYALFILLILAVNIYTFSLPMEHRV